jgi:S-adenosylmethionine synthetase
MNTVMSRRPEELTMIPYQSRTSSRVYLLTSESVSEGHPDKMADKISDSVLDAALAGDKDSRVACETLVTQGTVFLAGEITSRSLIKYEDIARGVIRDIGYTDTAIGMDCCKCSVILAIKEVAS